MIAQQDSSNCRTEHMATQIVEQTNSTTLSPSILRKKVLRKVYNNVEQVRENAERVDTAIHRNHPNHGNYVSMPNLKQAKMTPYLDEDVSHAHLHSR